ncbi:MAG: ferrous iron transport protein A [Flavobacteriales bacterium]|nr:ferrous iron transport protein A [Flavobacteriales bacterium]
MIPLTQLKKHVPAIIERVEHPDQSMKLMEMGCLPGERIVIEHIAPLGDPIAVSVAGYKLSMRKADAQNILVKMLSE